MEITRADIKRWHANSLSFAQKLGYDSAILDQMPREQKKVLVGLDAEIEGKAGIWFGYCAYNVPDCLLLIGVSPRNLATESEQVVELELRSLGIPEKPLARIMEVYRSVPREDFFEVYNQSGMDHELIGHGYNYLKGNEHGEEAAVREQLRFAKERAKNTPAWNTIIEIMPIVLGYLKGIDELK